MNYLLVNWRDNGTLEEGNFWDLPELQSLSLGEFFHIDTKMVRTLEQLASTKAPGRLLFEVLTEKEARTRGFL